MRLVRRLRAGLPNRDTQREKRDRDGRAHARDRARRGEERIGRGEHRITCADVESHQRCKQRIGA